MIQDFEKLGKEALARISGATKSGDLEAIARNVEIARACKDGSEQFRELERLRDSIVADLQSPKAVRDGATWLPAKSSSSGAANESARQMSHRARGRKIRQDWLVSVAARGVRLRRVKGDSIYETTTKNRIGIATATERRPDKWFLGLPDERYETAILLCHNGDGGTLDFVLPSSFLSGIWKLLSRSEGQVKFHVERSGVNLELKVPGGTRHSINSFRSNLAPIK